jgi:DNA repair exonuclease SbcCD ATPase subunit
MTYDHDTPRTDAAEPQLRSNAGGWVRADFARELERELNASQAEVEELQQQKRNCIEILDDDAIEIAELKAEVERLSKLTEDCLNVIRVYCPTYYNDAMERFNITTK